MIRRSLATAVAASLLVLTAACGGDDGGADGPAPEPTSSTSPGSGGTSSGDADVTTIEVTVADGVASTAGQRVEVGVGQPVDLVITSDTAGEMHVHSTPEQFIEFDEGTNPAQELVIDRPGRVEIELHEPTEGPVVELLVQ